MRHLVVVLALLGLLGQTYTQATTQPGSCFSDNFGSYIDCGGGYVIPTPPAPPATTVPGASDTAASVFYTFITVQGPNGPCVIDQAFPSEAAAAAFLAANPGAWLNPLASCPQAPAAPAAPAPPPDPGTVAVQFWKTIPLPVPKPSIPPGYAICGKTAYLLTGDTVDPPPYHFSTPLGPLTITATGVYRVDWGDDAPPGFTGPYPFEGQPYPDGRITHTYDNVGTYTVTVVEDWTAMWQLGAAGGTLDGLQTRATIPGFQAEQLQAVVTN